MRGYRKYRRYKRRESRVRRKERTFHRWLAVFMAAVLLMGECNLSVLAEEVTSSAEVQGAPDELSSEETDGTGSADNADEDNTGGAGDDENGAGDAGDVNGGDGLSGEDNADEDICVCENRCSEDRVNEDCPVCVEDYVNCTGQENGETEESDGSVEGELPEGDAPELPELAGGAMNGAAEAEAAAEEAVIGEAAVSGDEGIEAYAFGDIFTDAQQVRYRVIDEKNKMVEVAGSKRYPSGDVIIPETVNGYSVTSIGDYAFDYCISLTSIEIPGSVTSIGNYAFHCCNSLTSIEIPNSVTSIGNFAFYDCRSLTSIEIPVGYSAFIGDYAFSGCSSLTSVKIPDGVTSIGRYAFYCCNSLTSIEIPNSVTSIGRYAFYCCSSLTSIEIPDSVTSIGVAAFYGCSSLTSIEIPGSVISIGDQTFMWCSSLTRVKILEGVTSIGVAAFYGCSSLTGIEIPDSVTSIGDSAFYGCSSLTSIEIPGSITRIGNYAFWHCKELRTLRIVVPADGMEIKPPSVAGITTFLDIPDDRSVIFITEDGTPLTGSAFETAKAAYKADARDGDDSDNLWWGWKFKEPDISSSITIHVRKDDTAWTDHNRTFGLKQTDSPDAALITDFAKAADGQYRIYDITGVTDGASGTDTGVTLTVNGGLAEAAVDYYTVTFYDGDTAYAADTLQAPQTVLKGKNASKPADHPVKTGHWFKGWVTEKGGSSSFDFDNTVIEDTTSVYADWTADIYSITYHLEGYEASQEDSTYTYGGRTLPAPVKSGYDFNGWYTNEDYSGDRVTAIGSAETGDKVYYGRWVEKPESTYCVSIKVKRDGGEWENHGRTFMLRAEAGSWTASLEKVAQGTYYIYDVTGVDDGELFQKGVNTDIRVSVEDKDVEVTVDYYTVTFYDGSTAYGEDTPQAMQTVLGGKNAKEPEAPSKEGYKFRQWVTNNESEAFNFNTPIKEKSSVYASWISNTAKEYCIAALADEGGSISPGNVWVQEGGTQIFEITPDDGYRIKAVTVDGMDRTDELTDSARARAIRAQAETSRYYTFVDVRDDHVIRAVFEKESGNTGDNGNTGTGDTPGDGGSAGTGGSSETDSSVDTEENEIISVSTTVNADSGAPVDNTGNPSKDTEPKTGDTSHVEIYATVAMIAGLTYLLLYFADKEKGMTEEKKQELVASMIGWAKRGRRIRKYVVLVPIFILLCYYHSIGKRIEVEWDEEPVWAEL